MSVNGEHLSTTAEHFTPAEWVERARAVMGGIDTDPCSCEEAQKTVRAMRWYGVEDNGLAQPWTGRVFVNPPGDRTGKLPGKFFSHLANEVDLDHVQQFVWLAFNASHLRTLQSCDGAWLLAECDIVIPSQRIRFTGDAPTKDNAFLYWGHRRDRFRRVFGAVGQLWRAA